MPKRKISTDEVEGDAALYALDALPSKDAEQFRQRLAAGCSLCQGLLKDCQEVVAFLPMTVPEVEPPRSLRASLLSRIAGEARRPPAELSGTADGLIVRAGDGEWVDAPSPGVQYRQLQGRKTMLVRMQPNTWLPAHEHKQAEQCLVLEGSIRSEDVTVGAGDYVYMPAGSVHSALYSDTGALFLIAYT